MFLSSERNSSGACPVPVIDNTACVEWTQILPILYVSSSSIWALLTPFFDMLSVWISVRNHPLDHFSIVLWNFSGFSVTLTGFFSFAHFQPHDSLVLKMRGTCHFLKRLGDLGTAREKSIEIVSFLSTYPYNMNLSWILCCSCSIIPNQCVLLYIVNHCLSWSGQHRRSRGLCPSHCCVTSAPVGTGSKMKTAGAYCCHPSFKCFGTILPPNPGSKKVICKASETDGYLGKWSWSDLLAAGWLEVKQLSFLSYSQAARDTNKYSVNLFSWGISLSAVKYLT